MKNCKNGKYKIKKKEKNNLYKKDFHISLTNKFLLFILTIIHLIIKAKADGSIIIYGFTNIVIYIKDASSYINSPGSCSVINGHKLNCNLSNGPITIYFNSNFDSNFKSASYMFKDCYGLTSIDLSNFAAQNLNETDGMFENCVSLKSINFGSFPSAQIINMSRMFYNCSSLEALNLNTFNTSLVKDMSYMFTNCSSIKTLVLSEFDTKNVIYMNNMFELCKNLTNLTQKFVTSSVKNMEYMFSNCKSLESLDISKFDTSLVTSMNSMFRDCSKLNSITFPNTATSFLVNMASMFQSCSSLVSIELPNFDTSSVIFMSDLFHDCTSLTTLEISNFNTENVIKMEAMFQNCKSLKTIDLTNFYTPAVRQIYNLFYGCTSVTEIKISNFDTFQVTNFANLFYNCHSLITISLTNFVTNMASDMSYMFYNCSSIASLDLRQFNTERVIKMNSMFQSCSSLISLDINNFNDGQVIDMSNMFNGCIKLASLLFNNFQTPNVKYMNSMFSKCESLTELDLSNFITTNVINMNSMFYGCISVTSINLSKYNTSNVIDMGYMFYNCLLLTSIDLSCFQTEKVENMDAIFYNCKSLKTLSLDTFSTSNVITMKSMFQGCSFLELLDLSNFETNKVSYMDGLFYDCNSLIRLDLTNFDVSNVKSMGYMFYGCKSLTSLNFFDFKKLSVTNTSYMFAGCSSLSSMDLTHFDSKNVLFMDYMFSGCTYLNNLILTKFNTEKVKTMDYMFAGCASLTSLNILDFNTPNLQSIKGMFYGCSSLKTMDLSNLNFSSVVNMAYMFYKASLLLSLHFSSNRTLLDTKSVENMKYMFAYCSKLENVDLSFFDTSKVVDMSYMFHECLNLTSVNLSSFTTPKVVTMENMFYKCSNMTYVNIKNVDDTNINVNNILEKTPWNMVFCINENSNKIKKIKSIIDSKKNCVIIDCEDDYNERRLKLIREDSFFVDDQTILDPNSIYCHSDCQLKKRFEYLYICYKDNCPNGSYHDENDIYNDYSCQSILKKPDPCTIQKMFLGLCTSEKLFKIMNYNDSESERAEFIDKLVDEIGINFTVAPTVLKNGVLATTLFNETFHFTSLSYKIFATNLTFIDIQDCENFVKKESEIDENEELILLQMEYLDENYKIPIIEYKLFRLNGKQLNISKCGDMKFIYYIPININETDEYKYNPESAYNNEICFQYTAENNTDKILYERRREFNEYNISLCENNCKFLGYNNKRVECECPVEDKFNRYYNYTLSEKDNLIFRFPNNKMQSFNFGVIKCFKMVFTSEGFYDNYSSVAFIAIIALDIAGAIYFCFKGYKTLFAQIKTLNALKSNMNNNKKKNKINNIMTVGNNPPPKPKLNNKSSNQGKQVVNDNSKISPKVEAPGSLIDSKNKINQGLDANIDKLNEIEETFYGVKDMELNMLPYLEAQKKDKRGFFSIYLSFLKTRQLIISIFIFDYNSLIIKVGIFIFCLGVSLGISTIFFTDEIIQKIYLAKGEYNIPTHITNHITLIIISMVIVSIIKSIISLIIYTDTIIVEIKQNLGIDRDNKVNQILIKVTSRCTLFFIISFFIFVIFWVYVASFCAVFKNTQIYLLINAGISFGGVNILPFFYYFIPALFRKVALNGQNSAFLYRFSQFFELI